MCARQSESNAEGRRERGGERGVVIVACYIWVVRVKTATATATAGGQRQRQQSHGLAPSAWAGRVDINCGRLVCHSST